MHIFNLCMKSGNAQYAKKKISQKYRRKVFKLTCAGKVALFIKAKCDTCSVNETETSVSDDKIEACVLKGT